MKIFDLAVRGKQTYDLLTGRQRRDYDIPVNGKRIVNLTIETLPNKIATYIRHTLRISENVSDADILHGESWSVSHPIRLSSADIEVHTAKTLEDIENGMHLETRISARICRDVVPDKSSMRIASEVTAVTSRLRLLSELDDRTLGELDSMTLEELDYLKG